MSGRLHPSRGSSWRSRSTRPAHLRWWAQTVQTDDDPANDHIRIFNPAHIDQLRKQALKKNVGLIVLDPALDVLDSKVKTADQMAVRQALSRIQAFAKELEILILGIAHFNKMNSVNDAIDGITGSAAFSQRVRAALVFAYNEEDDCFVISQGKNNWGPLRQPNLAFTAEPRVVGDGIETGWPTCTGGPDCTGSAWSCSWWRASPGGWPSSLAC